MRRSLSLGDGHGRHAHAFNVPGPSEWRSYLFLAGKNGRALDSEKCPLTTDYEAKFSGTNKLDVGKLAVRVYFEGLQECSRAIRASGS